MKLIFSKRATCREVEEFWWNEDMNGEYKIYILMYVDNFSILIDVAIQ